MKASSILRRLFLVGIIWGAALIGWSQVELAQAQEPELTPEVTVNVERSGLVSVDVPKDLYHIKIILSAEETIIRLPRRLSSGSAPTFTSSGSFTCQHPACKAVSDNQALIETAAFNESQIRLNLGDLDSALTVALPVGQASAEIDINLDPRQKFLRAKVHGTIQLNSAKINGSFEIETDDSLIIDSSQLTTTDQLLLRAANTLQIRDSEQAVLLQAGSDLILQGDETIDIFALSQPHSALVSGGNMTLRSRNAVQGDAHYLTGGEFRIEQLNGQIGDLVSPYDPVVFAANTVAIGNYTGASLHILAGGGVKLSSAVITGTDTVASSINASNGMLFNGVTAVSELANLTLSDGTKVAVDGSTRPTLDIRAGIDWTKFKGGAPADQVIPPGTVIATFGGTNTSGPISVGDIELAVPEGMVLLTNQYFPQNDSGDINANIIDTSTTLTNTNGGQIIIDSRADVTTDRLFSFAQVSGVGRSAGNGGDIRVLAPNGDITAGDLVHTYAANFSSGSGNVGDGGNMTFKAKNGISLNGGSGLIRSYAWSLDGNAGRGGNIELDTGSGDLELTYLHSFSYAPNSSGVDGGDIRLTTDAGSINITSGQFGYSLGSYVWGENGAGNGGTVALTATQGITVNQDIRSYALAQGSATGTGGSSGDISLYTANGNIQASGLDADAFASLNVGNGGAIALTAPNGAINTGVLDADSSTSAASGNSSNGGSITLSAGTGITVSSYVDASASAGSGGAAGNGNDITLQTTSGSISTGALRNDAFVSGSGGSAGNGGNIQVMAPSGAIITTGDILSFAFNNSPGSGNVGNGGDVLLKAGNGININNGNSNIRSFAWSWDGNAGSGGNIELDTGSGDLELTYLHSFSYAPNSNSVDGGDIRLTTDAGSINITAEANGYSLGSYSWGKGVAGSGGTIALTATQGITINHTTWSSAFASNSGGGATGNAGAISLYTTFGNIQTTGLDADVVGDLISGDGGAITLTAPNGAISTGVLDADSSASTTSGTGGPITVSAGTGITVSNSVDASASASSGGTAGNGNDIILQTTSGSISTGALRSDSFVSGSGGSAGNGGNIQVMAPSGAIVTTDNLFSFTLNGSVGSGNVGSGGDVILMASSGININNGSGLIRSYAWSRDGNAGSGGNIELDTGSGDLELTYLHSFSYAPNSSGIDGGDIRLTTGAGSINITSGLFGYSLGSYVWGENAAGNGGTVALTATQGITVNQDIRSYAFVPIAGGGTSGNAGAISLNTTSGNIQTVRLDADVVSDLAGGDGGSIALTALNGAINTTSLETGSFASDAAGNGGPVNISAPDDIQFSIIDTRSAGSSGSGQGGPVQVTTQQFLRGVGVIGGILQSIATQGLSNSGAITLTHGGNGVTPFTIGDSTINGMAGTIATAEAEINPDNSYLFTHFETPNIWIISVPSPLAIEKSVIPEDDVKPQDVVTYTIVLRNNDTAVARDIMLTDTLPLSVSYAYGISLPGGVIITPGPPDQITWSDTVAAQGVVTLTFAVTTTGSPGESITNTVTSQLVGYSDNARTSTALILTTSEAVYLPIVIYYSQ